MCHVLFLSSLIGVKGLIYTSDGKPAPDLSVVVDDRMVVKTTPLGEYWKLLLPGNYSLKVNFIHPYPHCHTLVQITTQII